jgi:hypothetical protein
MFTSSSPFAIASSRARRLLSDIEEKIQRGEINTRAGLLTEIILRVSDFTQTLREPSLKVPRMVADDLLIRELVSEPMEQAAQDIDLGAEQVELTRNIARQVFNVCQAERSGLKELLAEVTAHMDELRLWISDSDSSFMWVGDTFNDRTRANALSTTLVDTAGGTVTLQPDGSVSLSDKILSISIDKTLSFSGLPGNNTEIRSPGKEAFTGDRKEPRPILFRDRQPRSDNLALVLDGNPDTWFEWERVYCFFPQTTVVAGHAHVFDPAGKPYKTPDKLLNWNCFIRWPGEDRLDQGGTFTFKETKRTGFLKLNKKTTKHVEKAGYPLVYFRETDRKPLELVIQIELDQPRHFSWIQLTPFIREGAYPEVTQILVSNDGKEWRKLLEVPTILNPRINRGVDFAQLSVPASNFEGIGVWPVPRSKIKYVKLMLRQENSYRMPLGLGHRVHLDSKGKKRVRSNAIVVGSHQSSLSADTEVDFANTESETTLASTEIFDVLNGERQMIGIRDLLLEERSYRLEGQFVSQPFNLASPARAVALLVTERIPQDWPRTNPEGKLWIFYEVSTDGQNWQPIVPQVAQLEDSVVRFESASTTIHFRATFTRPEDRTTETPILHSYALKILP